MIMKLKDMLKIYLKVVLYVRGCIEFVFAIFLQNRVNKIKRYFSLQLGGKIVHIFKDTNDQSCSYLDPH